MVPHSPHLSVLGAVPPLARSFDASAAGAAAGGAAGAEGSRSLRRFGEASAGTLGRLSRCSRALIAGDRLEEGQLIHLPGRRLARLAGGEPKRPASRIFLWLRGRRLGLRLGSGRGLEGNLIALRRHSRPRFGRGREFRHDPGDRLRRSGCRWRWWRRGDRRRRRLRFGFGSGSASMFGSGARIVVSTSSRRSISAVVRLSSS